MLNDSKLLVYSRTDCKSLVIQTLARVLQQVGLVLAL